MTKTPSKKTKTVTKPVSDHSSPKLIGKPKKRGPNHLLYVEGCKNAVRGVSDKSAKRAGRVGGGVHLEITRRVEKYVALRIRIGLLGMQSCGRKTLEAKDLHYASAAEEIDDL